MDVENSSIKETPSVPVLTIAETAPKTVTVTLVDDDNKTMNDLNEIPLLALRQKSRLLISRLLNCQKILPSENGFPRDWRGIAHLAGLKSTEHESAVSTTSDPMAKIFQLWSREGNRNEATFGKLISFLELIDRFDVIQDIKECLEEDAEMYNTNNICQQKALIEVTVNPIKVNQEISEGNLLTKDDVDRATKGLSPQFYDAFVLFADEDIDFATELIERMENFGLKLCVKERDLIGGVSFEHEAILRLISERCNRLIVIVSPSFLKSPANNFFVNFAQALGIEQRRRKIVPCLYEHCTLPPTLSFYFLLNYQRAGRLWNFWDKLRDSIKSTPQDIRHIAKVPSITITECNTSTELSKIKEISTEVETFKNSMETERRQEQQQVKRNTENRHSLSFEKFSTNNLLEDKSISYTDINGSYKDSELEKNEKSSCSVSSLLNLNGLKRQKNGTKVFCDKLKNLNNNNNNNSNSNSNKLIPFLSTTTHNVNASEESSSQVTGNKKPKWYKKILNPKSENLLATTTENNNVKEKTKRKWFKKKVAVTV